MGLQLEAWKHRPALDGLRAIAALHVILFHARLDAWSGGYVGVDVFFVLSGFLLTSILLRRGLGPGLDVLDFYARRVRRLLPTAALVLVVTLFVFRMLPSTTPLDHLHVRGGAAAAALYGSNWWFLEQAQDYFAHDAPSPFLHYWSLSVEEQFYLVWPFVLLLVLRVLRWRPGAALALVAAVAAASLAISHHVGIRAPMESYFGTHARAWQPLAGALVALVCATRPPLSPVMARVSSFVGLAGVLVAALGVLPMVEPLHRGELVVAAMVLLLLGLEGAPDSSVAWLLSVSPLRRLGDWSYEMYLWHWPIVVLLEREGMLPEAMAPRLLVVLASTVLLSATTHHLLGKPLSRVPVAGRTRRVVFSAVVGAVAMAGLIFVVLPVDDEVKDRAERMAEQSERSGYEVEGSGARVALIGDSHMAHWTPAFHELALRRDWTLVGDTRNACPWPDLDWVGDGARVFRCSFEAPAADVVFLAGRAAGERSVHTVDGPLVHPDPGWAEAVAAGSRSQLEALVARAGLVVVIEPIPELAEEPLACLSADRETCDVAPIVVERHLALEEIWRAAARDIEGVETLDLDELVCPDGVCPAEVDGEVTRRDTNHLTPSYTRALADGLGERLPESLR
ncbi:MAG: acyltransferase [Proteobacteria bacterium]|nr:acyltransferase [Pseudomonadota bacterium]MCP4921760.1 acyltransferase [Pseudomonadota bacterium]